jgi:hypothetical protein
VKRLRQLKIENGRLQKMVADRDLKIDALKEITSSKWQADAERLQETFRSDAE